jgi:hypothetical protein
MRSPSSIVGSLAFALAFTVAPLVQAARPWVDRSITLPRHDWAFDFGLGIAHVPGPRGTLGPGFNLEGAVGVTRAVQLGLRTGFRFDPVARAGTADVYGRPFDTETYGTGVETVANPEFYVRGSLIEGDVVELGLEGRVMSPFSEGLGLMFGVPLAFHFGRVARLDTGVYVPVLFYDPTRSLISFPFHLWFQLTDRFWLGPMAGVRILTTDGSGVRFLTPNGSRTEVLIGFGLGYSVTRAFDFKAQFLFEDVANGPAERWGFGAGIEVRIE